MTESKSFDAVVVGSGFGGTVMALTLANMYSEPTEKIDGNLKIMIQTFNVEPGKSQTRKIKIEWSNPTPLTLTKITFSKYPNLFSINSPNLPLIIKNNVEISVTFDGSKLKNELNEDIEVEISVTDSSPRTIKTNFHIGNRQVCILERGQWWLSHEVPFTSILERKQAGRTANMLEYLVDQDQPFNFWAHPDNTEGLLQTLSMTRMFNNKRGLYDIRHLSNNVNVLIASGVGGGSLIYSNVTIRPEKSSYKYWPTEEDNDSLEKYFDIAEKFIGVNKIMTNAGVGNQKLERPRIFQKAMDELAPNNSDIMNKGDYSLNLSITDMPNKIFDYLDEKKYPQDNSQILANYFRENIEPILTPDLSKQLDDLIATFHSKSIENLKQSDIAAFVSQFVAKLIGKYQSPMETNVCQRQARCNLGCIPGARHTMNKKLFQAIIDTQPLKVLPLCEASWIQHNESDKEYPYTIWYRDFNQNTSSEEKPIKTKMLIVSSGTLGSTELLLASQKKGMKFEAGLVGSKFSTNADLLAYMKLKSLRVDNTRGPINISHAKFKINGTFAYNIEDTSVPPMTAGVFATMFEFSPIITWASNFILKIKLALGIRKLQSFYNIFNPKHPFHIGKKAPHKAHKGRVSVTQQILEWLGERVFNSIGLQDPVDRNTSEIKIRRELDPNLREKLTSFYRFVNWIFSSKTKPFDAPAERLSKYFIFSCMGIDKSNGTLKLNDNNSDKNLQDPLKLDWKPEDNAEIFNSIMDGANKIALKIDPSAEPLRKDMVIESPTWNKDHPELSNLVLLHPLGGCAMSKKTEKGVVNSYGQVYNPNDRQGLYTNFYVVDGSIIPKAVGVNPSLTITALAFRTATHITKDDIKHPKFLPS